jgi:sterol desaturase/sphingolipid hydroxylase (fatty acid hydroxylase superfamily)
MGEHDMKPFSAIASVVLAFVAVVQFLRLTLGWSVVINGNTIPMWVSVVACIVAATLSVMVWRESRQ